MAFCAVARLLLCAFNAGGGGSAGAVICRRHWQGLEYQRRMWTLCIGRMARLWRVAVDGVSSSSRMSAGIGSAGRKLRCVLGANLTVDDRRA